MNNAIKILTFSIFIIFLLFDSAVLKAESSISAENCAAQAHLNFRITIPETLFLQVGALQPDAGSKSFSIKNKNESDLAESGKKSSLLKPSDLYRETGQCIFLQAFQILMTKKARNPKKLLSTYGVPAVWIVSAVLTHSGKTNIIHFPAPTPAILLFIIQAKKMSENHLKIEFIPIHYAHHNYNCPAVESNQKTHLFVGTNLLIKFLNQSKQPSP